MLEMHGLTAKVQRLESTLGSKHSMDSGIQGWHAHIIIVLVRIHRKNIGPILQRKVHYDFFNKPVVFAVSKPLKPFPKASSKYWHLSCLHGFVFTNVRKLESHNM